MIGQALVVVISGSYGRPSDLSIAICLLQVLQLFATLTVFFIRQLMFFYSLNIFWKAFAPTTVNSGRGVEFGAIIAFLPLVIVKKDKKRALVKLSTGTYQTLFQVIATVLVFVAVLYLQGFRYPIPVKSNEQGSMGCLSIRICLFLIYSVNVTKGFQCIFGFSVLYSKSP